jgi:hypothetical protein
VQPIAAAARDRGCGRWQLIHDEIHAHADHFKDRADQFDSPTRRAHADRHASFGPCVSTETARHNMLGADGERRKIRSKEFQPVPMGYGPSHEPGTALGVPWAQPW